MKIENYIKGWLVGDFEPSLIKNKDIEIINNGGWHFNMMNVIFRQGEIVIVTPNIYNQFECIEDACILVIKTPSIVGDKYIVE